MKKIIFLSFLFLLFAFNSFANTEIKVLKVYDGDTILAKIDDNIFRIRLIDIDCFEGTLNYRVSKQAKEHKLSVNEVVEKGNIAGQILNDKLKNNKIYFEFKGIDKYNRALGYLYIDKRNINKEMIKTGYCFKN